MSANMPTALEADLAATRPRVHCHEVRTAPSPACGGGLGWGRAGADGVLSMARLRVQSHGVRTRNGATGFDFVGAVAPIPTCPADWRRQLAFVCARTSGPQARLLTPHKRGKGWSDRVVERVA
jgi:hypothetical protein